MHANVKEILDVGILNKQLFWDRLFHQLKTYERTSQYPKELWVILIGWSLRCFSVTKENNTKKAGFFFFSSSRVSIHQLTRTSTKIFPRYFSLQSIHDGLKTTDRLEFQHKFIIGFYEQYVFLELPCFLFFVTEGSTVLVWRWSVTNL